jgi:hypothetical protein
VAFERAWRALNEALGRRVRVSVQMRVTACVFDSLGFVTLLRDLEAAEIARSEKRVNGVPSWDSHKSFQFGLRSRPCTSSFERCRILCTSRCLKLEATGHRAGTHSSMQDCNEGQQPSQAAD